MNGEKIPYHLRPNKFVDRALFIDILSHVNRYSTIADYLYVSFGGPYLEDFKVIHSTFGNRKMLSLEQTTWVYDRQLFNVPYGCVQCVNKTSQQFLTDFTEILSDFGDPHVIIWLDYAAADRTREQLTEFETTVSKLRAKDIVKVTLNANPSSLDGTSAEKDGEAEDLRAARLQILKDRIGDYVPNDATSEQMKHSLYPVLLLQAVHKAVMNAMMGAGHLVFQPLSAYVYEDSHQMLTVTGIMLGEREVEHFLQVTNLKGHEFATNNWKDVVRINVPYLSAREKLYLDSLIFKQTRKGNRSKLKESTKLKVTLASTSEEAKALAERYIRFYRYYPHYHRIHY